MSSRKRKKWSRDLKCVSFPDDIESGVRGVRKQSALSSSSSTRSWEKCGESFVDCPPIKDVKIYGRKPSVVRKLVHSPVSGHRNEDQVDIVWTSSSDSGQSDKDEDPQQGRPRPRVARTPPATSLSLPKTPQMLSIDEDDLAVIETDESEQDGEQDSGQQISDYESPSLDEENEELPAKPPDLEISGYASDGETDVDGLNTSRRDAESLQAGSGEGDKRSVSYWVRYARAMLRTPQKPFGREPKTPEDSAKKKRKFQSGGLAERLNRLHNRQRSAVSFWRHCSTSDDWTETEADRPGVLVLEVLEVQEECGAQLVRCLHRPSPGPADPLPEESARVMVLLSRETAAKLSPAPADIIRIFPPWQRLPMESLGCDIILNTHFSRKISPASEAARALFTAKRLTPYPLCRTFGTLDLRRDAEESDTEQLAACDASIRSVASSAVLARQCHSLLEVIEGLSQAGSVGQDMVVVVQRVYTIPAPATSIANGRLPPMSSDTRPPEQDKRRLCVLVQDSFGMFSVLQLHLLAHQDDFRQYRRAWRGLSCVLRGVKVVQRLSRERRSSLFSLIDTLWPPPKPPLECHGNTPSMPSNRPPSFCYLLSGQESSIEPVQEGPSVSPLYLAPKEQTLREVLQSDHKTYCCSFIATVIYKSIQRRDVGQGEVWLALTDRSLQDGSPDRPCRRTVALHVNASCVLTSCVRKVLNDPAMCHLSFTDAIKENGVLLCVEHSIVEVADSAASGSTHQPPARPVRLDPLDEEVTPNSLCTLTGVIVGVDESTSYSWPVCSHCGSHKLQLLPPSGLSFNCLSCKSSVSKPVTKMQMEVFLSSASSGQNYTLKVKLQQSTIMSLLDTDVLERTTARPEIEDLVPPAPPL
ncbi:DNA repair-scaffolding protein isoform X2 [Syngnathoides biaculeatus]|uniref:DNA repair-scaffolding protein isoform X2 n=1 Tax=Syngnathoides biaculeatus TaxID=300417 RepID=UPI002ADD9092|nr:DNA repair-scaffolding protein isoform X2 [Syngnathoides biaculeatus]